MSDCLHDLTGTVSTQFPAYQSLGGLAITKMLGPVLSRDVVDDFRARDLEAFALQLIDSLANLSLCDQATRNLRLRARGSACLLPYSRQNHQRIGMSQQTPSRAPLHRCVEAPLGDSAHDGS